MPATNPASAERLRQRLLLALTDSRQPMTTAELRNHVHERFDEPVVIEAVYRNLTVLLRRGDIRRSHGPGRGTHWAVIRANARPGQNRRA